jgi:hypothetical protein
VSPQPVWYFNAIFKQKHVITIHLQTFIMKNLYLKFYFSIMLTVTSFALLSQDQIGIRNQNYAGLWGLSLNPTNTAMSPLKWDANLMDFSILARNNYAFVRNTGMIGLIKNSGSLVSIYDTSEQKTFPSNALIQDFYNQNHKLDGALEINALGLAIAFRVGEHHQLGLFSKMRMQASAYQISNLFQYKSLIDLERYNKIDIAAPTGGSGMLWSEIGLNYAWRSINEGDYNYAFGISPRVLLGLEGGYFNVNKDFSWQKSQGDTITIFSGNWDYALTPSNLDNVLKGKMPKPTINGKGIGLDLGFSIAKPDDDSETPEGYIWKFGAAILDIGAINFNENAQKHHLEFETEKEASPKSFMHREDLMATIQDASKVFLGDSSASLVGNSFKIGLPSAITMQFDHKIIENIYVSTNYIQRISMSQTRLKRATSLAIAPRFEKRKMGVSVPIHLTDWRTFRMGAAIRMGGLAIGTDHLGALVKTKHLSGADFYFGLKINTFSFKKKNRGGFLGKNGRKWDSVGCFKF